MTLHQSTFEYMMPSAEQKNTMEQLRQAAAQYAREVERLVPEGPDKTFILRAHRANAMWVNVAVTRNADGSPRA